MNHLQSSEEKEYNEFIKRSVADGSYFKDAREWYIFRYIQPICERTILFFINIFTAFVTYILVISVVDFFPIKEEVPIRIIAKDTSRYFSTIKPLKDSINTKTIDESVLKYLLTKYVEKRENFDFREEDNIEKLSNKILYIKNNSSIKEHKNFQKFLSRANPASPIKYFDSDFQRIANVESVYFPVKKVDDFVNKAKYFVLSEIPESAEIRYEITTKINSKIASVKKYLVKVNFNFSGVDSNTSSKLEFAVTSYQIYTIK
ncbi:MAG: type IV secretion system protein VirB8 [Lentimonas sp.]|jgi:type IV secretion system protein VirB8